MKEYLNKLETVVEKWHKPLPHLPANVRKWIGDNIWWIVIVGAIVSTISVLIQIGGFFTLLSFVTGTAAWLSYYGATNYSWWSVVVALVSIAFSVISALLLWLAAKPLQDGKRKGWGLLFLNLVVQAVAILVTSVLSFNIFTLPGLVFGAIGIAIATYLLYEIRSHFVVSAKPAKKTTKAS